MAVLAPMPSASVSTATVVKPGFFSNWRKANLRSFISERFHGIDFRRAPGGQPTGYQGHEGKKQNNGDEGGRIRRAYAVEQTAQEPRQRTGIGANTAIFS